MRSEERRVGKGVDHCVTGVQTCALPIWIKSAAPNALPLILTHGWPGSVLEFHKMIDALSTPHEIGRASCRERCRSLCDWSSDVCSSDLDQERGAERAAVDFDAWVARFGTRIP